MKSETSFRVFFLKQHRKNSLKNIFSHQKVYFWISAFDHRAIILDKMHIVHWWALCRRESLDSLSCANLDLLACSLHLNQSQLCSAWSSQIIAGIGRVIRRLQSFQARERSVPARGRVPGTSAACLSTVRLLRGAWKDHEVPARVITRWRESRSGAEVQARAEQEREQWGKNPGHAS